MELAADSEVQLDADAPFSDVQTRLVGAIGMGAGTMLAASVPWEFHWDDMDSPAVSSAGDAKIFFVGETSQRPVVASVYAEVKLPLRTMLEGNITPGGPSKDGDEYTDVNMSFLVGSKAGPATVEMGVGYTHRFGPPNDAAPWRARVGVEGNGSYVAADASGSVQTEGEFMPEWSRVGGAAGYEPQKSFTLGLWGGWTFLHQLGGGAADLGIGIALHG